jgi:hypothetical protein
MPRIAEAYVDIGGNLNPLASSLSKARGMLSSFAGKGIALAVGGAGVGGIAAGLFSAAKAAADLGESISKIKVTFGDASGGILDSTDKLAGRFGVVKQEALDAAAAFGLMGRAAGLGQAESAKMAKSMVQLGLDLASFHNISNEEAFAKIRSGLAGEAEPLRPLGIMLSEDAVKAEALALGLTRVKRELTEQQKIVARISLIRKGAGPAEGDLERTSDSAANQLRALGGELTNAAAEFGQGLIGSLQQGVKMAREIREALGGSEGIGGLGRTVGTEVTGALGLGKMLATNPLGTLANSAASRLLHGLGLHGTAGAFDARLDDAAGAALGIDRPTDAAPLSPRERAQVRSGEQQGTGAAALRRQFFEDRKAERDRVHRKQSEVSPSELAQGARALFAGAMGKAGAIVGGVLQGISPNAGVAAQGQGAVGRNLRGPRGRLLRGAMQLVHGGARGVQRQMEGPSQSERFSSASEFGSWAVQAALSQGGDEKKQQVEQLEAANKSLQAIASTITAAVEEWKRRPAGGAVVRGPA